VLLLLQRTTEKTTETAVAASLLGYARKTHYINTTFRRRERHV